MIKKVSLRNKAVIFAIALGTLPVIGCSTLAYYLTNKNTVKSTIQSQQFRANHFSFLISLLGEEK